MAQINPSLTLPEKKRIWKQTVYDDYKQVSQDKSTMFNYFIINNDIFKMISPDDQFKFKSIQNKMYQENNKVLVGSFFAILLFDQIILRKFAPNFFIKRFRPVVVVSKYMLAPGLIAALYKEFFMDQYKYFFYNMQEKYSFGFQDYMKANRIFERALNVDRLQQLFQKRDQFDWTGIPQLPDEQKNQKQTK